MAQAITDDRWVLDLAHRNNSDLVSEVLDLHRLIQRRQLNFQAEDQDQIRWNLEGSGQYSSRSAYALQFLGSTTGMFQAMIWAIWAPAKLKMFAWLLHQNRLWCNDRLQRRGWPNSYFCQLCLRNLETSAHLFWSCPFTKTVWTSLSSWQHCQGLSKACLPNECSSLEKVEAMVSATGPAHAKGIKSLIMLVLWKIWQERNSRVFRKKEATVKASCRGELCL